MFFHVFGTGLKCFRANVGYLEGFRDARNASFCFASSASSGHLAEQVPLTGLNIASILRNHYLTDVSAR